MGFLNYSILNYRLAQCQLLIIHNEYIHEYSLVICDCENGVNHLFTYIYLSIV